MQNTRTFRKTFFSAIAGIVAIGAVSALRAQAPAADTKPSAFEVASVKPNKSGDQHITVHVQPGGRFTATNTTLRLLIRNAYRVQDFQISGGPNWVNSEHFDIQAKAEGNPSPDEFSVMMRALLADRFKLVVRNETRELPVYALVLARSDEKLGPQLQRTDCASSGNVPRPGPPNPSEPQACGTIRTFVGHLTFRGVPMSQILQGLSDATGRTVVNRTELTGSFDLDLHWTPDQIPQKPTGTPEPSPTDASGPSIFTAVQEQLGLKLESTKGPVDVLVIDHAEQPSED
jgi:uncharacterized protein (TIGR03435 family)